jgi:DNA excision repair protein ERCC-2
VYNYAYVIDPKIKDQVSKEIEKESIIVFDEAHNIDNVCIESLSCNLNGRTLTAASKNLATLNHTVKNATHEQAERLRREVEALERGMRAEFATQVNHEHTHLSIYLSIGNRRQGGDLINYEEAIAEQMPGEK